VLTVRQPPKARITATSPLKGEHLEHLALLGLTKTLSYGKWIKMLKALILKGLGILPSILVTLRTLGLLLGQELA